MQETKRGIDSSCWHYYQRVWHVCVCVCVFNSKMAPTFHSPLSLPLLTSAALRFENSDTVVRATAAAQPQPKWHILTLCAFVWDWGGSMLWHKNHTLEKVTVLWRHSASNISHPPRSHSQTSPAFAWSLQRTTSLSVKQRLKPSLGWC